MAEQNTSGQITTVKKEHPIARFFKKVLIFFILLFVVVTVGAYFYFNYTYSEGSRAGMLVKFSEKGYIFKTYEGDLNLGGINPLPGNTIANNIWKFSVKDDSIGELLKSKEGQMLRLHYKEKVKNFPWQGDTKFFVDGVDVIK
ncbi:MAG TPA: hypothetical protein PLS10_02455 [Chitinophagales bacterium]|nr:hypothetical protein [Chitinophagales bacterium]